MITHWHLLCLLFGNFSSLLCAMEIQVNQSQLKLVCSGNALLLCSSDVTRDCIDTSLCKTKEERQRNETRRDIFISLNEALCNQSSSHFSLNTTDILNLKDCWRYNIKSTNNIPELICSAVVFLSIIVMFLSYLCLKKTLNQYLSRKQKAPLYVRPNQPNNVELL